MSNESPLSLSLAIKLVSIVVHTEELIGAQGHPFDKVTLQTLLDDEEVKSWVRHLHGRGLTPIKR